MTQLALKLEPVVDLAPWRNPRWGDAYWVIVEAAAREVTGENYDTETLTQALARFGYERATVGGVRCIARNGRRVRASRNVQATWIWLARLKRRAERRR